MSEIEIYNSIRNEIIVNHILMHGLTVIVVVFLLVGIWLVERQSSILSVMLPLLSLAWAAAIVRFDFFIHRQAAYLRALEASLQKNELNVPLWESWKFTLFSARYVVPIADSLAVLVIVIPTVYLLFGPSKAVFEDRQFRGHRFYAWSVLIVILLLLASLPLIPRLAAN